MERIAIVAARRTAIGTFGGMFASTSAVTLGVTALTAALGDAGIRPDELDEVITGNVLAAGLGQNVARQIGIGAGTPVRVPAYSVNKVCGSGMKAIALGAGAIALGDASIVAAGGTENMTLAPYAVPSARFGARMGNAELVDTMVHDALTDTFSDTHMGITAENLADRWKITREEMDAFAFESQRKCGAAMRSGAFHDEIVAVSIPQRKGEPLIADTDEHPRPDVTIEALAKLRPAFRPDGRVTAGSSSGVNDGAAMVILASESAVKAHGLAPLAWIVASASAGVEPAYMGYGPVPATRAALARAKWNLQDVELAEINEAFAAQSLAVLAGFGKELGGIDRSIVNVNGGAIALGHPVGASGARILVTLVHEMRRRNARRGMATLCIGGGQGMAMLVER